MIGAPQCPARTVHRENFRAPVRGRPGNAPRAEHWRRRWRLEVSTFLSGEQVSDPAPDPERAVVAEQELEACADLRIQPEMKGSVAFMGLKRPVFPYRFWVLPDSDAATLTDPDDDLPDLTPRRQ